MRHLIELCNDSGFHNIRFKTVDSWEDLQTGIWEDLWSIIWEDRQYFLQKRKVLKISIKFTTSWFIL